MTRTREHALRKAALPYGAGVIRATGEIVLFNRTYELLWRLPPEDGQQAAKTRNPYSPHWITDADGYEIEPLELAGRFPVRGTRDQHEKWAAITDRRQHNAGEAAATFWFYGDSWSDAPLAVIEAEVERGMTALGGLPAKWRRHPYADAELRGPGTWDGCRDRDFWDWVRTRKVTDNPRGDFVKDTRDLYEVNRDPNENMLRACYEAEQQHAKLRRQYDRSRKKAATGAPENGAAAPAD